MHASFQHFLQGELADRCQRNRAYSLRAFALALGISPSHLSRLLSGERQASAKTRASIGTRLGLSTKEMEAFTPRPPRTLEGVVSEAAIEGLYGDWVGMAILEMTSLMDFVLDARAIAARLEVSVHRVRAQVRNLLGLGFLEKTQSGGWLNRFGDLSLVRRQATSKSRRSLLRQRLELASQAIDHVPFTRRDHSFVTSVLDEEQLPDARHFATLSPRHSCARRALAASRRRFSS